MRIVKTIREINRGGFGIIEEVLCDDDKHYAKKTFFPSQEVSDEVLNKLKKRFKREVQIQTKISSQSSSQYIMPILDYDLDCPNPWFLMPIAEYDYSYEVNKCISESRNPEGLSDILNALEYIHKLGYVHRDLKPGNILYHEGKWKLSDLGLITQDNELLTSTITSTNETCGTAFYMAPEQLKSFKRVDRTADIYSFGAILHDIFGGGYKVRTPYSELTCSGDMGIIVGKCTKKEPKRRFQNVDILRSSLLSLLSKNDNLSISSSQQEYIDKLKDFENLKEKDLEDIIIHLKEEDINRTPIFYELNNNIIDHLFSLDRNYFTEFCLIYTEWVENSSFLFDYCDVIIKIIVNIYQKTDDIELKSRCVISAAELGKSHNRWFVMRNVIEMANTKIDESLALRIQIEISIEDRYKQNFIRCAEGINNTKESYHKLIADAL